MPEKKPTPKQAIADAVANAEPVDAPDQEAAAAGATEDGVIAPDAGPSPSKEKEKETGLSAPKRHGKIPPERITYCAQQPQNDTGNARRLLAHFGEDVLHVREVGWHCWTGAHWESEGGDEALTRYAQDTAERIVLESPAAGEASEAERVVIEDGIAVLKIAPKDRMPEQSERAAAYELTMKAMRARRVARYKYAISSGNAAKVNAMIAQALPHKTVAPEEMDKDALAFNVLNGTLRFFSEVDKECPDPDIIRLKWSVRIDKHKRGDNIAKLAPVTYDPAAKCPKWEEFLVYFQPERPILDFLRDFHGYGLLGLTGDQTLIFNYGTGANGKSTFTEAVWRICGPYAQSLNAESVSGQNQRRGDQATPDFARLPGARLCRVSELPRGEQLKESLIKMLTGGEPMLVRHLNKGFFEFRPIFKAAMSGNDKPEIHGVDEGIWRRVRLVPWRVTMPDAERRPFEDVQADFAAERSGILNWLIEGALAYLNNGGRLSVPEAVSAATEELRKDMDPVGEFLDAHVVFTPGGLVTARDLYTAYVNWCHANAKGRPFSEKRFAAIMQHKPYRKLEGRVRKYEDIELFEPPPPPDPGPQKAF